MMMLVVCGDFDREMPHLEADLGREGGLVELTEREG
jgi:hypothetical protein